MSGREPQIQLTRGLPASGKTTYARGWVNEDPVGRARVNRDDLRFNLYGVYWGLTYEQEVAIAAVQKSSVEALLRAGKSVIVDDTNLRRKYAVEWIDLAVKLNCQWQVADFTLVPVDECVRRDAARIARGERGVGEEAIRDLHRRFIRGKVESLGPSVAATASTYRYEPDPSLPNAFLVDVDGTLAALNGRGPFEWKRVGEDKLIDSVAIMVRGLARDNAIILMSGRDESCRPETEAWLAKHGIPHWKLFMRPEGDQRKDAIVKLELFREKVAPYNHVLGVLDDRNQVVEMWRSIGLMCAQVAPGDF